VNLNIKSAVFWVVIVLSAFFLWQTVRAPKNSASTPVISYSEFLSQVEAGQVTKVTIGGHQIVGSFRNQSTFRLTGPGSQDGMLQALHQQNVEIWFTDNAPADIETWLLNLAPLVLLAVLWLVMIRRMNQKKISG
jgi:cell division protease FtsH